MTTMSVKQEGSVITVTTNGKVDAHYAFESEEQASEAAKSAIPAMMKIVQDAILRGDHISLNANPEAEVA